MELGELSFSFTDMQWLLTIAVAFYAWLIGRQSARAAEVLEIRVRLTELETQMKQVPTSDQMGLLTQKLAHLDARMEGIANSVVPIATSLDRINDYLLKHR